MAKKTYKAKGFDPRLEKNSIIEIIKRSEYIKAACDDNCVEISTPNKIKKKDIIYYYDDESRECFKIKII